MPDITLSALFPSVPVTLGTERLQIRPVILAELPTVERVVEGWRILCATGGDFLHAEAWGDFLDLCAAAVDRPKAWLDALAEPEFERLICLVLAINEDIWQPEAQPSSGDTLRWSEIVQRLVEHGHPFSAIQGYTLAQAKTFLGESFRLESDTLARAIQAASFAMADGKSVTRAVKELRRG